MNQIVKVQYTAKVHTTGGRDGGASFRRPTGRQAIGPWNFGRGRQP